MSFLMTIRRPPRRVVQRAAQRALFATNSTNAAKDTDCRMLSAELLRGLSLLKGGCPVPTQTIENISTEEVIKAVKARDFGAIANLQWTIEVDYLYRGITPEQATNVDEYSSDFEAQPEVPDRNSSVN